MEKGERLFQGFLLYLRIYNLQVSGNRGPNSRFVVEAIFKPLVPKLSRNSIIITQNHAHAQHDFQPNSNLSEYQHAYTNTDSCKYLFQSKYRPISELFKVFTELCLYMNNINNIFKIISIKNNAFIFICKEYISVSVDKSL